ncbi:hypothetical protein Tco_1487571 [Tanacetum coccineum]
MGSVMRQKPEGDHNLKNFATHHGVTYEVVWRSIKKVIKALQKPFIAHVLLVLLLLSDHQLVLAASGGRMGGRSFSSSSSRRSRIRTRRAKSSSASNYCTQANSQESDVFLFVVSIIILIILETIKIIVFNKTTSVLKLQKFDPVKTFPTLTVVPYATFSLNSPGSLYNDLLFPSCDLVVKRRPKFLLGLVI